MEEIQMSTKDLAKLITGLKNRNKIVIPIWWKTIEILKDEDPEKYDKWYNEHKEFVDIKRLRPYMINEIKELYGKEHVEKLWHSIANVEGVK